MDLIRSIFPNDSPPSSKLGKICKNPENLPYQPRERTGEPVEEIVDENFDVAAERRLASAMRVAGCEDARTVVC